MRFTSHLRFRSACVAWLTVAALITTPASVAAQQNTPTEIDRAIEELAAKLTALAREQAQLDAAIAKLDASIQKLRNKTDPVYVDRIIADLIAWVSALSDAQKAEARKKLPALGDAIEATRDATDTEAVVRLAGVLAARLDSGRFNQDDLGAITQDPKFALLEAQLMALASKTKPLIHIISATYGDHSTGRTCNAMAYFHGQCEGKPACPVADIAINGADLCGHEPAPLAAAGKNAARVTYKCIAFGRRPLGAITCAEGGCGTPAELRGKGKIRCSLD